MNNRASLSYAVLRTITARAPAAIAYIRGSGEYPALRATARFWSFEQGTVVAVEADGLPDSGREPCAGPVFALHIHAGRSCTGTPDAPFADADGHYNPNGCEHPHHAGDLPPLFSDNGRAWLAVYTDRFRPVEVIGRTMIIHRGSDDFKTQPSGDAGAMIACGVIDIFRGQA